MFHRPGVGLWSSELDGRDILHTLPNGRVFGFQELAERNGQFRPGVESSGELMSQIMEQLTDGDQFWLREMPIAEVF